VNQETL